jgi:NAD(P)-dependent dehydrogenase (short-subunit alcohol dehydrogenase family)
VKTGRALVTGAANGIGRAIAERLVRDGVEVVGLDREAIDGRWCTRAVRFDLERADEIASLFASIVADDGPVDALVNAAGTAEVLDLADFSVEIYERTLAVDLHAPVRLSVAAAGSMGGRGYGRIVNITSIHSRLAEKGALAYDIAKAGLDQATRALAVEYSRLGVLCNAVAPGFVETRMSMVDGEMETRTERFRLLYLESGRLPQGRPGQPSDVASLVAWLVSGDNTYVTGQSITVDGGLTATF